MKSVMRGSRLGILAILVATGCSSPTQPSPAAPSPNPLAGQWLGIFEIASCAGPSFDCSARALNDFTLAVVPIGAGLQGFMVLETPGQRIAIDLVGTPDQAGSYAFTTAPFQSSGASLPQVDVRDFALRDDPVTGLAGSFTYAVTSTWLVTVTRTAIIRSASRRPPAVVSPGHFQGTWVGDFVTRTCTGGCRVGAGGYFNPTSGRVTLQVVQEGAAVVGSVQGSPVSGTATASTLSMTGPPLTPDLCPVCWDCSGWCATAVQNLTANIDKLGRLTGRFEYSVKGNTGSQHFMYTMEVELSGVTRQR
jgi:hypothetical protein